MTSEPVDPMQNPPYQFCMLTRPFLCIWLNKWPGYALILLKSCALFMFSDDK